MSMQVKTRTLQNFIGGKFADSEGEAMDLINPSTGEVFAQAPISTDKEIDAAFKAAATAFPGWRDATPSERSLALLRIAESIEANARKLVEVESENTGKPLELTLSEEIHPPSTRCGSSPAPPASSRAAQRASTWPPTPR